MLRADFENHAYTAEVLKTTKVTTAPADAIESLLVGRWEKAELGRADGGQITLRHGFVASRIPYHRSGRIRSDENGRQSEIPRKRNIRGQEHYMYDVLLAECEQHIVVAVPFHGLAGRFYPKVDSRLAGSRVLYEKLNITRIIVHLASQRPTREDTPALGVTRCQLAYEDTVERRRDVEQVRMTGANLGVTQIYRQLIEPVLRPSDSALHVTPIVLGFASFIGGVKKASAVTDRHGNFKVHIGPGLRQLLRIFDLLDSIKAIKDVVTTTGNVPILQGGAIAEES